MRYLDDLVTLRLIPTLSRLSVRQIFGKAFADMLPICTRSLHELAFPGGNQQGRNVLDYLTFCFEADRRGQSPPFLMPVTTAEVKTA